MLKQMKYTIAAVALTTAMMAAGAAQAGPITFSSGDGANESNNVTGTNVVITPHSAWGNVGGGASWISYANTGIGGSIAPNAATRTRADATTIFTEALGFINSFSLRVLGDDTVTVDLYNLTTSTFVNLFTAFPGQINPCAPGGSGVPVGCVNADMGVVLDTAVTAGNYELRFYGFQTNADVYGVQYTGTANTVDAVPEPMSAALLGLGILGLAGYRRRMKAQTASQAAVA